jgi:hypothetical protein
MKNLFAFMAAVIMMLFLLIIIVYLVLTISYQLPYYFNESYPSFNTSLTYEKCCNGSFCTDTYYLEEDNLCHFSLCEGSLIIFNKSRCVYNPE